MLVPCCAKVATPKFREWSLEFAQYSFGNPNILCAGTEEMQHARSRTPSWNLHLLRTNMLTKKNEGFGGCWSGLMNTTWKTWASKNSSKIHQAIEVFFSHEVSMDLSGLQTAPLTRKRLLSERGCRRHLGTNPENGSTTESNGATIRLMVMMNKVLWT